MLLPLLTTLCNRSIMDRILPPSLKKSILISVLMVDGLDSANPVNYIQTDCQCLIRIQDHREDSRRSAHCPPREEQSSCTNFFACDEDRMISVDSIFNILCGPLSTCVHLSLTLPPPPCGRHKWMAPYRLR